MLCQTGRKPFLVFSISSWTGSSFPVRAPSTHRARTPLKTTSGNSRKLSFSEPGRSPKAAHSSMSGCLEGVRNLNELPCRAAVFVTVGLLGLPFFLFVFHSPSDCLVLSKEKWDTSPIFRCNELPQNPAQKQICPHEYVEIRLPLTAPQGSSNFRFLRDGQALKTQERPRVWSCRMRPKVGVGHVTGCTFCHNTPIAQIPV